MVWCPLVAFILTIAAVGFIPPSDVWTAANVCMSHNLSEGYRDARRKLQNVVTGQAIQRTGSKKRKKR